jgi:GNAT superfamily N-acetyltransferase
VHVEGWQTTYRGIVSDEVLDSLSSEDQALKWSELLSSKDHRIFVVEDSSEGIIGFADCGPERRGNLGFAGELYAIYLKQEYHGRGIGKMLFRQAVEALVEEDFANMMVWVLEANPSRRFYEALGGSHFHTDAVDFRGQSLTEYAYGWNNLEALASS